MITPEYVRLMTAYTRWQTGSIYAAADTLTDEARKQDRGAFFGSIHATLNHLLWGDQLWMHRLAGTPAPRSPDIPGSVRQFDDWETLKAERRRMDDAMLAWSKRVTEADLDGTFSWFSGAIQADVARPRRALVIQLFNHGTHHRGQVHAMLTAAGAKPEDTDIPFMNSPDYPWPG